MKTNGTRLISLLLIALMLLAFAAPALADEKVAATTPLNLRSGPGTNYPIVGSLKKGETATRIGTSGGWSILKMGNAKVYASSNYLTVVSGGGSGSGASVTMYTTGRVNVRTGPGTGYKVLSTLNKGDAVSLIGSVGKWSIIQWNSGTAYMFTEYLAIKGGGGGVNPNPATGTMEATTNVNVRSGPGSNYSILGMLTKGERVERTGVSGNWIQVLYKGRTAYVYSSYLKAVSSGGGGSDIGFVEPASGTMMANINVNVRTGPGTNYAVLGTLYKGDKVERTGVIGNWTRINYKGQTAFVFSSYLNRVSGGTTPAPVEKMYVIEDTWLLDGPGAYYNRIANLKYGDVVILIERSGAYSKVEYGTKTGYVLTSYISTNLIKNASGLVYAPNSTRIYDNPDGNYIGMLSAGDSLRRTGVAGNWTRVEYYRGTAYVLTSNIVALTDTDQVDFKAQDKFMYGRANGLPAYTVPVENKAYVYGYITLNEKVRLMASNNTWSKIYAEGRILYMLTSSLKEEISSGGSTLPQANDKLKVKAQNGAGMYINANLSTSLAITEQGVAIKAVPVGTQLIFESSVNESVYYVTWEEKGHSFYIKAEDVEKA